MTHWTYGPEICATAIEIDVFPPDEDAPVRTIDLEGAHVLIDVDYYGRVVSIEILGPARNFSLEKLREYLKEEPNV
jgi:uncharacterized protein YuzE